MKIFRPIKLHFIATLIFFCKQSAIAQQQRNQIYPDIGFKTIRQVDQNGTTRLISMWYPAEKGKLKMNLRDYLVSNKLSPDIPDNTVFDRFKSILERLFYRENKIDDT